MGVIYKLKQEVIDYILELKRLDTNLSCRKISELASSRFQKEISKSSVNAILKDSALSSPIGRRGRKRPKEEKFKIPEYRKEQIFVNVPSAILGPQPLAKPSADFVATPQADRAGLLLLKAAEWQIKRQGVLRFLCEKHTSSAHEDKIFRLAESFLFLPVFNVNKEECFLTFDKKDFWEVNDVGTTPTPYQKAESFDLLRGLESKSSQVLLDHGQIFSEASFFEVLLEDGSKFCLDSESNCLWDEENVHCGFSSCLDKNFDFLSTNIINNTAPLVLRQPSKENNFSQAFFDLMAAFENVPGKRIKRIDLMTYQKEIVSSFERPLQKKRHFIVGIYECDALAQKLFKDKEYSLEKIRNPLTNELYSYAIATTAFRLLEGEQVPATIIFLSVGQSQVLQFGLLTNMAIDQRSAETAIRSFLERWPDPLKGYVYFKERSNKNLPTGKGILSFSGEGMEEAHQKLFEEGSFLTQSTNTLLLRVHDYARRHFFPEACLNISFEEALKRFYQLPGKINQEKDALRVKISSPATKALALELAFIVHRVNESFVRDPQGRRMIFSVDTGP